MHIKLFVTLFLGIVAAGIVLYLFVGWQNAKQKRQLALLFSERRGIGFGANMAKVGVS